MSRPSLHRVRSLSLISLFILAALPAIGCGPLDSGEEETAGQTPTGTAPTPAPGAPRKYYRCAVGLPMVVQKDPQTVIITCPNGEPPTVEERNGDDSGAPNTTIAKP
jgi:hypothetical protein